MSNSSTDNHVTLLEAFKQHLLAEDTSKNTVNAYLSDLSQFMNWYSQTFAAFDVDDVTPTDIRDYRAYLQEQIPPAAPATINRRLASLRHFFRWAKEQHFTVAQPMERIRNVESTVQVPKSLDRKQCNR